MEIVESATTESLASSKMSLLKPLSSPSGRFMCFLSGVASVLLMLTSTLTVSTSLPTRPGEPNIFRSEPQPNIVVNQNAELIINCQLWNAANVTWQKNGNPVTLYPNVRQFRNEAEFDYSLRIFNANPRESGNYRCIRLGEGPYDDSVPSNSSSNVFVRTPPAQIDLFMSPPTSGAADDQQNARFTVTEHVVHVVHCIMRGANTPANAVVLVGEKELDKFGECIRNDAELKDDCPFTYTPDRHDNGRNLTCIAEHAALGSNKELETSAYLNVKYAPVVSIHVEPEGPILVEHTVTLTCTADGNPEAVKLQWLHNGQNNRIISGEMIPSRQSAGLLELNNVTAADAGEWQCVAESLEFKNHSSYELEVIMPPTIVSDPVVQGEPVLNRSMSVTCIADGTPELNYTWFQATSTTNGGHKLEPRGTGMTLSINPVRYSDDGLYQCVASNSRIGKSATSQFVRVDIRGAPQLYFDPNDYRPEVTAEMGKSAVLSMSFNSRPEASGVWRRLRNGPPLANKPNKYAITTTKINTNKEGPKYRSQLTVQNVKDADMGEYFFYAANDFGKSAVAQLELRVKEQTALALVLALIFVAVLLVLSLFIFIVLCYRRKLCCFKSSKRSGVDVETQRSTVGTAIGGSGKRRRQENFEQAFGNGKAANVALSQRTKPPADNHDLALTFADDTNSSSTSPAGNARGGNSSTESPLLPPLAPSPHDPHHHHGTSSGSSDTGGDTHSTRSGSHRSTPVKLTVMAVNTASQNASKTKVSSYLATVGNSGLENSNKKPGVGFTTRV